ncbi:hypothetical protein C8J56DRAFT_1125786 [Mycena floridula]|nr:hypothetical protein C8J56DRAFT_1125786 [Mycena floridula]
MPPKPQIQIPALPQPSLDPQSPLTDLSDASPKKAKIPKKKKSDRAQEKLQHSLTTLIQRTTDAIVAARNEHSNAPQRRSIRKAASRRPEAFRAKLEALKLESLQGSVMLKEQVHAMIIAFENEISGVLGSSEEGPINAEAGFVTSDDPEPTTNVVPSSEDWRKDAAEFQKIVDTGFKDILGELSEESDTDRKHSQKRDLGKRKVHWEDVEEGKERLGQKEGKGGRKRTTEDNNLDGRSSKSKRTRESGKPNDSSTITQDKPLPKPRKARVLPTGNAVQKVLAPQGPSPIASLEQTAAAPPLAAVNLVIETPSFPLLPTPSPVAPSFLQPSPLVTRGEGLLKLWNLSAKRSMSLPPVPHHSNSFRASSLPSEALISFSITPKVEVSDVLPSFQWAPPPDENELRVATKEEMKELMEGVGDEFGAVKESLQNFSVEFSAKRGGSSNLAGHASKRQKSTSGDLGGFIVSDKNELDPDGDYEPVGDPSVKRRETVAAVDIRDQQKKKRKRGKGKGSIKGDIEQEEIKIDVPPGSDDEGVETKKGRGGRALDKHQSSWELGYETIGKAAHIREVDTTAITEALNNSIIAFFAGNAMDIDSRIWWARIAGLRPDAARMSYDLLIALLSSSLGNILCRFHFWLAKGQAALKPNAAYLNYIIDGLSGPRRMKSKAGDPDRVPGYMSCGCEEYPALLEYILWKEGSLEAKLWPEIESVEDETKVTEEKTMSVVKIVTEGWRGMVLDPRDRLAWYKLYMDTLGLDFLDLFTHDKKGRPIKNHEYNNLSKRITILTARKDAITQEDVRLRQEGGHGKSENAVASSSKVV